MSKAATEITFSKMTTLDQVAEKLNPVYKSLKKNATYTDCHRCIGKGKISGFSHVMGGVCFKCNGSQKLPANHAAKNARKLFLQFTQLKRLWNMGVRNIQGNKMLRDIDETIEKLPAKYRANL
tara:strand:- start:163 stop:531 length:369 start_codon:yes stop_codon:yes gene_type:complete